VLAIQTSRNVGTRSEASAELLAAAATGVRLEVMAGSFEPLAAVFS
jgi:hypothetical protein